MAFVQPASVSFASKLHRSQAVHQCCPLGRTSELAEATRPEYRKNVQILIARSQFVGSGLRRGFASRRVSTIPFALPIIKAVADPEVPTAEETEKTAVTPKPSDPSLQPAEDKFAWSYFFGQYSLGTFGSALGVGIVGLGFVSFFGSGDSASALELTYGVPIMLIGFALKYAELKPVLYEKEVSPRIAELRKEQCTPTMLQVKRDTTRHRYGDEQHLDEALKKAGLVPRGSEPPVLVGLREEERKGRYTLVLQFESEDVDIDVFKAQRERLETFFGPCVTVEISKWKQDPPGYKRPEEKSGTRFAYERPPEVDNIEVALISTLGQ